MVTYLCHPSRHPPLRNSFPQVGHSSGFEFTFEHEVPAGSAETVSTVPFNLQETHEIETFPSWITAENRLEGDDTERSDFPSESHFNVPSSSCSKVAYILRAQFTHSK